VCITVMNNKFIYFSVVQIYDLIFTYILQLLIVQILNTSPK